MSSPGRNIVRQSLSIPPGTCTSRWTVWKKSQKKKKREGQRALCTCKSISIPWGILKILKNNRSETRERTNTARTDLGYYLTPEHDKESGQSWHLFKPKARITPTPHVKQCHLDYIPLPTWFPYSSLEVGPHHEPIKTGKALSRTISQLISSSLPGLVASRDKKRGSSQQNWLVSLYIKPAKNKLMYVIVQTANV